jgi:hypothetical protein
VAIFRSALMRWPTACGATSRPARGLEHPVLGIARPVLRRDRHRGLEGKKAATEFLRFSWEGCDTTQCAGGHYEMWPTDRHRRGGVLQALSRRCAAAPVHSGSGVAGVRGQPTLESTVFTMPPPYDIVKMLRGDLAEARSV